MKVTLVCIAKEEDNYIDEWVEYNIKLGFDDIHLYQNDWRTDYEHPKLIKHIIDGPNKQRECYSKFLFEFGNEYDWAAFFDMDEFLVLKKHKVVQDFVQEYQNQPGIGVSWYLFGNNGHTEVKDNDYSVLKRFTKRGINMDIHIKTILNCKSGYIMDVHNPNGTYTISPNKIKFTGPFNTTPNDEIAQLNHYYCKTKEEFIKKCNRGRADALFQKNSYEINYPPHNQNDVEDLWAYNFMYGK